ncbi:hypothetical protein [Bartonella apis]|uniref:hypothetical protein n=1 Tax=Bartonella apis TaxID=1686310 RepID=UPI003AF40577
MQITACRMERSSTAFRRLHQRVVTTNHSCHSSSKARKACRNCHKRAGKISYPESCF